MKNKNKKRFFLWHHPFSFEFPFRIGIRKSRKNRVIESMEKKLFFKERDVNGSIKKEAIF